MEDDRPKSAVELAMERLRQRDSDSGAVEVTLNDEQKSAIAEVRNLHAAKVAELKILYDTKLAGVLEPATRVAIEDERRREFIRLNDDVERKIAKVRSRGN